jgi:hypothetical protein
MKVVFKKKDQDIIDKTTYTKRLDPQNDWVVPSKEESIKIVSCLQKCSWDGTVVRKFNDETTEEAVLADYYLDSTTGAVHHQHHIYFRTVTLYYPRVNYKWYAAATRDERRVEAEIKFANSDTPWEQLWSSDTDESETSINTHGDVPIERVQVRNLKYPDVRALVKVPPTEESIVVENWVACDRSDYNKYMPTKYTYCKKTEKVFRKILKKDAQALVLEAASLPETSTPRKKRGLNTENPYPVLDRVAGIPRPTPGFAVNETVENSNQIEVPEENKYKRKLRSHTKPNK